jgi:hypothetical protein
VIWGWGTWTEDRGYPAKDGIHEIIVYKRIQNYGEEKVFWKTARRKLKQPGRPISLRRTVR